MNIVLSWLATAGAAVLLVAVAVAWWEHRRRVASRRDDPAWFDTQIDAGALSAPAHLDLCLDHPQGQAPNHLEPSEQERDQSARQAVLASALKRMARHQTEPEPEPCNAWADTQPLVNPNPLGGARALPRSAVD